MTPEELRMGAWTDRLSRRAITVLLVGLLAFTLAEGSINRATGDPTPRGADVSICLASLVMTALAVANVNPIAVVGGITAGCQCVPLVIEQFDWMTCP